jgi:hypothetical protein
MKWKLHITFAIFCLVHTSAFAQVTYEGCRDFTETSVASVLDNSINDVAMARIEYGSPVIRYNTNVLSQMSEPTRRFFYVHECAHHALRHTVNAPSLRNEKDADCWALNAMRNQMNLSIEEMRAIQQDIAAMGRGDWTHMPGPQRSIELEQCPSAGAPDATIIPHGFPSGYGMQPCGCWGPYPSELSPEPRCSSGQVRVTLCPAMCTPQHPAYAWVCL